MAHERFKEKRHANPVLKNEVCACPYDQLTGTRASFSSKDAFKGVIKTRT
jgi:hypothetical protein